MTSHPDEPKAEGTTPSPQGSLLQIRQKWREVGDLLRRLEALLASGPPTTPSGEYPRFLVVINGRRQRLTERQVEDINPKAFDFYLDLTRGLLLTKLGKGRGKFQNLRETPLQSEDLNTLAVLLEHANRYFGRDNLRYYLDDAEFLEGNTLSKRMGRIRAVAQEGCLDGPFIRRTSQADRSVSRTGFAFYFDGGGVTYCLIRFTGE